MVGHRNIGLVDDSNAIVWFGSLYVPGMNRRSDVRIILALAVTALAMATGPARSRTDLTAYADAERYIDVHVPACAALAGTWQGDADRLATWYSGWYNGLARTSAAK